MIPHEKLQRALEILPPDDDPWWTPARRTAVYRLNWGMDDIDGIMDDFVTLGIIEIVPRRHAPDLYRIPDDVRAKLRGLPRSSES